MAEIIDITTPWEGLSGNQVEGVIKRTFSERIGAEYFDSATNTKYNFENADKLAEWLSTGDDSLILSKLPYDFSGTQYQVKIISDMPKNLYFTTQADKAEITVSFLSQKKGITDVSWQDIVEDYNVSVYVDKGGLGTFVPLIVDQFVVSGNTFTFDVKKALATGANRVRVVAVGTESADKAQGSEMFIVNLTSMYLAPSNFTWYKPFIEGETYALGGMNIGGNLNKVLKVKVSKEGYERLYEVNIGSNIYTTTAYVFNGLEFPSGGTGVYNVDIWLDANGLESDHLSYNIICVSQADKFTAQLVAIGDPAKTVYNFSDNKLFEYCVYNGGTATATPHIKVAYVVNTNPTTIIDEDLVDVATASPLTYTASLEIEMEDESAALSLETLMTYGNEQVFVFPVDNSKSYPATTGAVFYMNPSARNNAQSNREKVINSITGAEIDAVFTRMAWTDGTDGWTTDDEGRKCLRLPAGCTMEMDYSPLSSVSQKTIELVYKAKNAADYDEPIFSICSDVNDPQFRGIVIRPKNILIHSRDLNVNDSLQDYNTTDEETLHVLITIIPNYKTNYGNLAQIYVNGDKVRSFSFETADRWDVAANMKFGSETADTLWYKARVYDRGFESYDALKNYINSLPSTKAKEEAKAKIEAPLDDSYKVTYDECVKNGLNTMVVEIIGQDQTVPSIANPSAKTCNTWIKINNPIEGELDEDFARLFSGEIIEGETIEGQGTTAMTYARWNFRWKLSSKYNKRRITAKKDFASSMHSHKMGATRIFNDLNRAIVGPNDADSRVAVYQYPVYGFQKILVEGTTDQYLYEFIGLYTIGPDKGDKATFGFDGEYESTLIHLEGTDHTPKGVGFDYPYGELGYSGSAEALGAVNATGAVVAAWECGAAGDYDPKDDPTETKAMLDAEFRPAYDVAELNSTYILGVTETLEEMNANISAWQAKKDAEGRSYADLMFFTDGVYDLYFYNTRTQKYEARGINMLDDLHVGVSGLSLEEKTELFKAKRRERFVANWETYWHKNDAVFHYAFVLLFGATDNFKKNTYPYKYRPIAEGGVYRWRQDDLDTLFDINNQGLAAKIYSILVGDKTETGSGSIYRGDTSAFWTLIKECFPTEIKAMVHAILDKMVELSPYGNNTLEKLVGCVRYYFWDKAQAYFPASAYSKDAEWTYEDTWAAGLYKEVNPLQQSLGGHKEAEIDWVTMRMLFCAMYFNYGPFGAVNDSFSDTSTGQIAYGGAGAKTYLITMACDGNPTILRGQSELVTFGDRVKAGETIELTVPDSSGADTRIYIQGVDWMEDIGDLSDLQVSADNPQLSVTSKRLQSVKIGDEDASKVTTNVQALNFGACPSMMIVDARNAKSLTGTIDLSKMPRLMEAYFGGTGVKAVNVPNGSKIAVLELGEETTQISLMNLKFMQSGEVQEFTPTFDINYCILTNQGVGTTCPVEKVLENGFHCCVFDCSKCEEVLITGKGGNNARLWCFLDSSNTILSVADGGIEGNSLVLKVPSNAAKMVCNINAHTTPNYSVVARTIAQGGFKYTALPKLEFLRIENCSQINPFTILKEIYNTDGNVIRDIRIIGFDVDGDASDVTMIANLANDVDKDGNPHVYNGIDAEGKPMDNSHPIIEGRLRVNGNIYEEDYEALKAVFSNLAMEFLGFYVSFKDPEVLRVLLEKITTDDGVGLTIENIEKVTSISTWFQSNTVIESFDEFKKFVGVTALDYRAFLGCTALKSIELPDSITTFSYVNTNYGQFKGDTALERVVLSKNLKSLPSASFLGCTVLKDINFDNVETLGQQTFWNCGLTDVELSLPSLKTMGAAAFGGTGIKKVVDLGDITTLGGFVNWDGSYARGTFFSCVNLESVVLPDTLQTITQGACRGCSALKEVNIPSSVTTIEGTAFYNCTALAFDELNLPNLTSLGQNAFYGVKIKKLNLGALTALPNATTSAQNYGDKSVLEEVVLSEELTTIPQYSFNNYENLKKINLDKVVTLNGNALKGTAVGEVELASIVTLGNSGLDGMKSLTKVHIGANCTTIGSYNFWGWNSTEEKTIIVDAIVPPSLAGNNRPDNYNAMVYVPDSSVEAYKAASGWSSFASKIYPMSVYENGGVENVITFADPAVEAIVLANWDNGDGYFMKSEAAAVTNLGTVFKGNTEITSFDEFENFTGITILGTTSWNNNYPFQNCTALTSIVLPESIKTIGVSTFSGCSALVNLEVKWDNIERLCEGSVSGLKAISGDLVLPKLTQLDKGALRGCPNITSLTLTAVTSIGQDALRQMTSLERVIISGGVKSFPTSSYGWDSGVMYGCTALKFAYLPATVTSAPSVFIGCSKLETVIFRSVNPPTITANTFSGCSALANIYVPDESVEAYKTATTWVDYANRIKGISQLATDNPTLYEEIEEYLGGLEIRPKGGYVAQSITLTCTYRASVIVPIYEIDGEGASIDENGVLTFSKGATVKVTASYNGESVSEEYTYDPMVEIGVAVSTNGAVSASATMSTVGFVPITARSVKWGVTGGTLGNLVEYKEDGTVVDYWSGNTNPRTIGASASTAKVKASFSTANLADAYIYDNTNGVYLWKGNNVK